jgi:hypothetical protein
MASAALALEEPIAGQQPETPAASRPYRLRPTMRQGTASSIPETWTRYATLEEARLATKQMYRDDRVLRVLVVTDDVPQRFVEWIER